MSEIRGIVCAVLGMAFVLCGEEPPVLYAEHVALDVASPEETAKWWCGHLGFRVAAKLPVPPHAVFITDSTGRFAVELYRAQDTPQAPDYRKTSPERMHLAFVSQDVDKDVQRLVSAGAELVSRTQMEGNELVMLRDPSGIPVQLVKRAKPLTTLPAEKKD